MLYSLLKKLEKEGLILGHDEQVSGHKPRRTVELTEQGRNEFDEWLSQPVQHTREIRLDFMVKLYFARQLNPQLALKLIEDQLEVNQRVLAQVTAQKEQHQQQQPENRFGSWVLDFRSYQNTAVVDWLKECRQQLLAS
jgi:DNA-binding PadR family transcriptional regulator